MSTPEPQPKTKRQRKTRTERTGPKRAILERIESHLRSLAEHSAIMVVTLERIERLAIASDQQLAAPATTEPHADLLPDPRIDPSMGDDRRRLVATRTHGEARYRVDDNEPS